VLDLVLELGELGDNLLSLVLLGGVVAGAHGAVGIVNRLGLEGLGVRTCPRMETKRYGTTDNDDGPSCPGRLVGERRWVARRVRRRCGIGLVLGIGSKDDSIPSLGSSSILRILLDAAQFGVGLARRGWDLGVAMFWRGSFWRGQPTAIAISGSALKAPEMPPTPSSFYHVTWYLILHALDMR
jgi:hypothetical protein